VKYGSSELPLVSGEELASAQFDSAAASGRVSSAAATAQERQARLAQLRAAVDESKMRAPFDGTIAARYFERGAHVRAGQALVRVVGNGAVRTRFAVPQTDAARVSLGSRISIQWDKDRRIGIVDRIAPEVEPASGTIFVEGSVDESAGKLDQTALAGRVVSVSLAVGR